MFTEREEVRRHFVEGDYENAVAASDLALQRLTEISGTPDRRLYRQILNEKARALRNLGRIDVALQCYVLALNDAHDEHNYIDEAWQLVLFGKLFGKYLQRHALFFACLREAENRFVTALRASNPEKSIQLRYAIVQDLLGSYLRRLSDRNIELRRQCERAYLLSLRLHRHIANPEGIARATCHLGYARAMFAAQNLTSDEKRQRAIQKALALFEKGLGYVLRNPGALRGRGTRRAQQAEIYLLLRDYSIAERLARESIFFARAANDPRALIIAKKVLAQLFLETGRPSSAANELEEALDIATDRRFIGFIRQFISDLAPTYLALDNPDRSVELLTRLDELTIRELDEVKSGFSGAIEAFRLVAPERADRYLVQGQNHDHQIQTRELIALHSVLHELISKHQRQKAARQQAAILRFARYSTRHALKNNLNELVITTESLKVRHDRSLIANLERVVSSMVDYLNATQSVEPASESASFVTEIRLLLDEFFPDRYDINLRHDVIFPHLHAEVLREVLLHFVENAVAAIAAQPPLSAEVAYFEVTEQEIGEYLLLCLKNPGANPTSNAMPSLDSQTPIHGYQNAYWFFTEVLGFDCSFSLMESGPASESLLSNCVTITVPMRSPHASVIKF